MYIKIDNLSIYYEKYGNRKQTILILPGWGDNRKTFNNLIYYLKEYFTIYIIDYPGFGNSTINKDLTIYDYANIINELVTRLHLENSILIGHSFGGRIISLLTTKYNIKYKKIILIDVAGLKEKNLKLWFKQKIYKLLKKISILFPKKIKMIYLKKIFQKFASNDYKVLPKNLYKTFQNVIKEDLTNCYQKINLETLILWGELDSITPLKSGIKLNKLISNSTIIPISNARHFPYLEKSYLVSNIIYYYLKRDII